MECLSTANVFLYKLLPMYCTYHQVLAFDTCVNVLYVLRECEMVMFAGKRIDVHINAVHERVRHSHGSQAATAIQPGQHPM